MADDRLIQKLEEQLSDAHASNGELRERVAEADKRVKVSDALATKGREDSIRLDEVSLKLKQAESLAHAAVRKQKDAERKAALLGGENEELREQLARAQEELRVLGELNVKIADAKHVGDLLR